nr:MAG TPA: hypothetical protein [Caudoviricetes sp.]
MENRKPIQDRLRENNLTYVWLIGLLNKAGLKVDKMQMSSAVHGTLTKPKTDSIMLLSHLILDAYEQFVNQVKEIKE